MSNIISENIYKAFMTKKRLKLKDIIKSVVWKSKIHISRFTYTIVHMIACSALPNVYSQKASYLSFKGINIIFT
jgi:hypothetical protein